MNNINDPEFIAAEEYVTAAEWYVPRTDVLICAAKYRGDNGAGAIVTAAEAAADHLLLARGGYTAEPVRRFVALVNAATQNWRNHA